MLKLKAQLVQAENTLAQDKISVEAANAQVGQAKAQVANAKNNVGYTDVVSSVNGFVSNMYLTKGQYVAVGQQVLVWWIMIAGGLMPILKKLIWSE